jgi:hypothetical protein
MKIISLPTVQRGDLVINASIYYGYILVVCFDKISHLSYTKYSDDEVEVFKWVEELAEKVNGENRTKQVSSK